MRYSRLLTVFELGSLLVMLTLAGPAAAAEEAVCSDPNVFFCENWEDRALGNGDFTTNKGGKTLGWGVGDASTQSVVNSGCQDGGKCLQQTYPDLSTPQAKDNGGGGFIGTPSFPPTRTVYVRAWVKYPSNWVNSPNGSKWLFHENDQGYGPRTLTEHVGGLAWPALNQGYMENLGPNMNPSAQGQRLGQWQCVESKLTMESTVGARDGSWEAWVNDPAGGPDIQVAQYFNIGPMASSSITGQQRYYTDYLVSAYWNCQCDFARYQCNNNATACIDPQNAHPLMQRLVDRIVVSRARIGCSGTASGTASGSSNPPSAPGQVQAK